MRWALFARIGRRFARLRLRSRQPLEGEALSAEFTAQELAEFLEGDLHPSDARSEFRAQLREELWQLVRETHAKKADTES